MSVKEVSPPKKCDFLFFFGKEVKIKNWRGKLVICPAAPNSFHIVILGNEMEITQHANPTVNTLLMKHTALTPKRVFLKPADLRAASPHAPERVHLQRRRWESGTERQLANLSQLTRDLRASSQARPGLPILQCSVTCS